MTAPLTHVIAGASLAGAKAAETLRAEGFDGRIVLIGAEADRPYERPALSKGYLTGTKDQEKVYVHDAHFYATEGVELRTGVGVTGVDPHAQQVTLDDLEELHYDSLLLATGAEPRRLDLPGARLDGVHYLRTLHDADRLREAASSARAAVVVGAGWIGSEVTASLRTLGLPVTMIDPSPLPLERVLGREVATVYRDLHAENGVTLRLGSEVSSIDGTTRVEGVRTSDGQRIDADLVVVGIGVVPRTGLAQAAGLAVDNGILVDHHLHTSAPDIYAAGDVANAFHPLLGARLRVEHWANALHQGITAAKNMLGHAVSYERIPYFFSDQYDLGMEYAGHSAPGDQVVFRGDPASREFLAFWLRDGRVVAGMNANTWDVNDTIQQLIRDQQPIRHAALADPTIPLAELTSRVVAAAG